MTSTTLLVLLLSLVGTSLAARLPYIVGGSEVPSIGYWPWQGSVYTRFGDEFLCGCSLISREWALTTASCVQSGPVNVRFGERRRNTGPIIAVTEVIAHASYLNLGEYHFNNIAALNFVAVELTPNIKPIELGVRDETGNTECYITGWGLEQGSDTKHPLFLKMGQVTVADRATCKKTWADISSGHICTKTGLLAPRTCQGDTGGPLVCIHKGVYELVGISSWQKDDCTSHPVYTSVAYFEDWILSNTGSYLSENSQK